MPGWHWLFQSEIEAFPRAVLQERFGAVEADTWTPQSNGPALFGDFTAITAAVLDARGVPIPQVIVAGTPCQAFSIAGNRGSLADRRGNLTLAFVDLVHDLASRPDGLRCALWENVPGVLSTTDNAFGCFLGGLVGSDGPLRSPLDGGRWPRAGMASGPRARLAWRVLDAQYFGLAQRRERVFVVVDLGGGPDPAAVLFERQGMRGNHPPRREAGQGVAGTLKACAGASGTPNGAEEADRLVVCADLAPTLNAAFGDKQGLEDQHINGGGGCSLPPVSMCLNAGGMGRCDAETETLIPTRGGGFDVAHALTGEGFDASEDGTGRGTPIVAVHGTQDPDVLVDMAHTLGRNNGQENAIAIQAGAVRENPSSGPDGAGFSNDLAYTLEARAEVQAVAFDLRGREGGAQFEGPHDTANVREASGGSSRSYVADRWAVRRLTPTETERLQGLPDGHTAITYRGKPAADGPRYKAIGNGMAVNCIRWIMQRIEREMAARMAA